MIGIPSNGAAQSNDANELADRVLIMTARPATSFRLEASQRGDADFIVTDKLGAEKRRIPLASFDRLICDYTANLKNILNFNVKMAKRAELSSETLARVHAETERNPVEGSFALDRVRDVG